MLVLACSLAGATLLDTAAAGIEQKSRSLFPRFQAGVPVLLYHRIQPGSGAYSVAPEAFAEQMRRLDELGFQAITIAQYLRFARGEAADLPPRPVLITFDDAHVSSWQNADPVLRRYGWSAVMYVPTGAVGRPGHLGWDQLRAMHASGRWHVEEHAGDGHVLIDADGAGRRLPFYAGKRWSAAGAESFARYKKRVREDIERGAALLARNLPGWSPGRSFAVPFNNYGQNGSNDGRIASWLGAYLESQFAVVFIQRDERFGSAAPGFANRIAVAPRWDAAALEARLRAGHARLLTGADPPARARTAATRKASGQDAARRPAAPQDR